MKTGYESHNTDLYYNKNGPSCPFLGGSWCKQSGVIPNRAVYIMNLIMIQGIKLRVNSLTL